MNVLIVNGDPIVRAQLQQQLAVLAGYQLLQPSAQEAKEALERSVQLKPDVVVLAAQLPDGDGLQVAAELQQQNPAPAVVVCLDATVPSRGAVQKTYSACLVTPCTAEELIQALRHAAHPSAAQLEALRGRLAGLSLSARTRRGLEQVPLTHALYLMADHKYVTLFHEGGELLLDESLKSLEDEFGTQLVRIHRHTLVLRSRMERLQRTPQGDYQLYLKGLNQGLSVSRRQLPTVRRLMPEAGAR